MAKINRAVTDHDDACNNILNSRDLPEGKLEELSLMSEMATYKRQNTKMRTIDGNKKRGPGSFERAYNCDSDWVNSRFPEHNHDILTCLEKKKLIMMTTASTS